MVNASGAVETKTNVAVTWESHSNMNMNMNMNGTLPDAGFSSPSRYSLSMQLMFLDLLLVSSFDNRGFAQLLHLCVCVCVSVLGFKQTENTTRVQTCLDMG